MMRGHGGRFHCRAIVLDVLHVCDLGVVAYTARRLATATTDAVADQHVPVNSTTHAVVDRTFELIVEDHGRWPSPFYQRCWSQFVRDFAALRRMRCRTSDVIEAEGISIDGCHTLARWRHLAWRVRECLRFAAASGVECKGGNPYRVETSKWPVIARAA